VAKGSQQQEQDFDPGKETSVAPIPYTEPTPPHQGEAKERKT